MLNCTHEFAPDVDKLTMDGPAPVLADPDGKYPVPSRAWSPTASTVCPTAPATAAAAQD